MILIAPSPPRFLGAVVTGIIGSAGVIGIWIMLQGMRMPERNEEVIEQLHRPAEVMSWGEHGLSLKDGRIISLPGCVRMPVSSVALEQMTKRGIEITPGGRVIGLVRVWHWCGNDPVREHIARVDIADALLFLKEGEWEAPSSNHARMYIESNAGDQSSFSEWGWSVDGFWMYEAMHEALEESRLDL